MTIFISFFPTQIFLCTCYQKHSGKKKINGILEYLNLYWCHFPTQQLPIFLQIIQFVMNPNWLLHSECLSWMLLESGTAKPTVIVSPCVSCFYCPPVRGGLSIRGCVLWWHRGRRRSLAAGRGWDDAAPFVELPRSLLYVLSISTHFQKSKKSCFVFPRQQEVGCFNLVEWFPKKLPVRDVASLYTQGQDLVKHLDCTLDSVTGLKHNSGSDTIAHSHIWFDILLPFQPCDVLSSPAWKDLTAGYFVKAFLGKTHPKPPCSQSSPLNIMYL